MGISAIEIPIFLFQMRSTASH